MENIEPLEQIYEMLQYIMAKYGVLGIAAAMFAESAGVPFASAIVLLASGTMILKGGVPFWSVFLASTIGITAGSIFSYLMGLLGGTVGRKVKRTFFNHSIVDHDKNESQSNSPVMRLWRKYGNFSIFMAQLWGLTRTFISYPAGAMHMNFTLFTLYTFLGGSIFSLLAIALSIALTGTMSLTLTLLKLLAELTSWLLIIPVVFTLIAIGYLYFRKRNSNKQRVSS